MTDKQIKTVLRAIRSLAMLEYPYPEAALNDPHLILALGEVVGITSRALKTHPIQHEEDAA